MILMKTSQIHFRDPYVLLDGDTYYLYGTRGANCWGEDNGLDCYTSKDLINWQGPFEVFRKPEGFWADRNYWAPECHKIEGAYYLFVSFKSEHQCRGTQILKSENPLGPFRVHSPHPITPPDWECLDGTYFQAEDGTHYMVFCHEWIQCGDGRICAVPLSHDLRTAAGDPIVLFSASQAPWSRSLPIPKEIMEKTDGQKCYVTDGPFLYRAQKGALLMLWSSISENQSYAQGIARSESGSLFGPWLHDDTPVFPKDGGHGMLFTSKDSGLYLVLHAPNTTPLEHPVFFPVQEENGTLTLKSSE